MRRLVYMEAASGHPGSFDIDWPAALEAGHTLAATCMASACHREVMPAKFSQAAKAETITSSQPDISNSVLGQLWCFLQRNKLGLNVMSDGTALRM